MKILHSVHPEDFKHYTTPLVRERFLLESLVQKDAINFVYTHYDRMIVGAASPVSKEIPLTTYDNLKAGFFLERREMGIINVGSDAVVTVSGKKYNLQKLDCLYIGRGEKDITFSNAHAGQQPVLFILSAPAHATYPTTLMKNSEATPAQMGAKETSNERTIFKYIHKDGIKSCQLVMGLTILKTGSVWNTMPPHTHDRRMEAYFYFDVPDNAAVFHYMGEPTETRHILIKNYGAVVSPPWSIHAGSGTANYGFIWGMAGENMEFADMDAVAIQNIL